MKTLVVFSHLRWNFVYQRPQHLLSRLASQWRVVFIEEPVPSSPENSLERLTPVAGVEVWRPHLMGDATGFHDDHLPVMQKMIADAVREHGVTDYWVWFYTPMAFPFAAELSPRGVVYDCMDELTSFKSAPRQLVQRENALFQVCDLVFTGGPSLYAAKRGRHPNVHCFPSSVDAQHFSHAAGDHPLQAGLPKPRLGYCGVIDERIDLDIVDGVAAARPDWQVVMVGPVAKIDPAGLPRRANIHWLGQQSYEDLPSFISGWDVCLLPFAINEATRYISPTKTLEYMACGKPSVSTAIKDVVEPYGHLVNISDNANGFVADCAAVLRRTPREQAIHAQELAQVVARTSWDKTAAAMGDLIAAADKNRRAGSLVPPPAAVTGVNLESVLQRAETAGADAQASEPARAKRA